MLSTNNLYLGSATPGSLNKHQLRGKTYKVMRNAYLMKRYHAELESLYVLTKPHWILEYPNPTQAFETIYDHYLLYADGKDFDSKHFEDFIDSVPAMVPRSEPIRDYIQPDVEFLATVFAGELFSIPPEEGVLVIDSTVDDHLVDEIAECALEPLGASLSHEEKVISRLTESKPKLVVYAPPHSGKSTMIKWFNQRLCPSCYERGDVKDKHFHAAFDTDDIDAWNRRPHIVFTNVPPALAFGEKALAFIPSHSVFDERCKKRGLDPQPGWYRDVLMHAKKVPHCFTNEYINNNRRLWQPPDENCDARSTQGEI